MIESAGDHGTQVVLPRAHPQALTYACQFTGFEQFVASCASRKFHCEPLQKNVTCPLVQNVRLQSRENPLNLKRPVLLARSVCCVLAGDLVAFALIGVIGIF